MEDFSSALSSELSVWLPSYSAQASIYPIIYWHDISSVISYLHTSRVNIWWCGLKKDFFWAFLAFINISIGKYHWEFYVHVAHLSKFSDVAILLILEEYPFTVIVFPSFLLSFDNNGICFLWNPLPHTEFRFIYNPPTFQKNH